MNEIILYHGSDHIIEEPEYGYGAKDNDYGQAFYCTKELYAGKEWANKDITDGVVNKYSFNYSNLKILDLTDKNKYSVLNWIAILMHFRTIKKTFKENHKKELKYLEDNYYIDVSEYDLVIGYRADDSYFEFPLLFVDNKLRLETLTEIYELGHLGVQYAVVSKKAFSRLKYQKYIDAEPIYKDKYQTRIRLANNQYEELKNRDHYLKGTRILDMVGYSDDIRE